jgi:hypothetical protein
MVSVSMAGDVGEQVAARAELQEDVPGKSLMAIEQATGKRNEQKFPINFNVKHSVYIGLGEIELAKAPIT